MLANVPTVLANVPKLLANVPTVLAYVPTLLANVPIVLANVPTVLANVPTVLANICWMMMLNARLNVPTFLPKNLMDAWLKHDWPLLALLCCKAG